MTCTRLAGQPTYLIGLALSPPSAPAHRHTGMVAGTGTGYGTGATDAVTNTDRAAGTGGSIKMHSPSAERLLRHYYVTRVARLHDSRISRTTHVELPAGTEYRPLGPTCDLTQHSRTEGTVARLQQKGESQTCLQLFIA